MCPHSPKGGIGKRVQKRGLNLWGLKGFFAPTPLSANPFSKLLIKGGSLHDGFGLALLLLVLQNTGRRGSRDGFDGFGGFGSYGRDGYPP